MANDNSIAQFGFFICHSIFVMFYAYRMSYWFSSFNVQRAVDKAKCEMSNDE
jgi:hypothetical protein